MASNVILIQFQRLVSRNYPVFLGFFCLAWAVVRIFSRPVLEVDEAEQMYLAQWWSLGYGIQPPLYTWLQKILVETFGYRLFPVGLLRAFCFWGILYFTYRIARRSFADSQAVLASLILMVCLPLSIYGFRTTHTLLLTAVGVATVFSWLSLLDKPTWQNYGWLGVCIGLGFLSKYNYFFIIASITLVSCFDRSKCSRLFSIKVLLTLFIAVAIFAIHGWWLAEHWSQVTANVSGEMDPGQMTYGQAVARGAYKLAVKSIVHLGSISIVLLLFYGKSITATLRSKEWPSLQLAADQKRILSFLGWNYAFMWILILSGTTSTFHSRWMLPLFILFPLPLLDVLRPLGLPRNLLPFVLGFALLLIPFHGLRYWAEKALEQTNRTHCDFTVIPANWELFDAQSPVYWSPDYFFSGNIKLLQPKARVFCQQGFQLEPMPDTVLVLGAADLPTPPDFQFFPTTLFQENCFAIKIAISK